MSERPLLRVVRGEPSDEELAALTAVVLAAAGRAAPAPESPRRSAWTDRASLTRRCPHPGPHAWRTSALPTR
jgi:Acyl-CoA carboxylase epsilon subunit